MQPINNTHIGLEQPNLGYFTQLFVNGVEITASGGFAFGTIAVAGQGDVVAESTSDILTLIAGTNMTLTTSPAGDSVTFDAASSALAESMVRLNTGNGYGSTNTKIKRFSTIVSNVGSDITYADSATDGASFTIESDGLYAISYTDSGNSVMDVGVSLNSNQLTTIISTITAADRLVVETTAGANYRVTVAVTIWLSVGDIIRAHNDGAPDGAVPANTQFTITRVA